MELARSVNSVWVRDSKDPDGDRLAFEREAFAGLLARVKTNDKDLYR
ncbi:DUF397 domain-containing protein [Actinomadura chokoriensis]|uniref:DUF397 domain-containing protein n=1 Tax=Actinomadura chokoriensis TaxID=454156 RepID=A0ABV4QR09_9ACTN